MRTSCSSFKNNKYQQLDLEAMAIDFALREFTIYPAGAPDITIITDHKPVCAIFNEKKRLNSNGSSEVKASRYSV